MKRNYIKPEIKLIQLRLNKFLTAGSGPDTTDTLDGETIENGNQNSRPWGQGMWDEMN